MKTLGILLILLGTVGFSFSSNTNYESTVCDTYYSLEKGMVWKMNNYNAKGKLQHTSTTKIINAVDIDGGARYSIEGSFYDEKEKKDMVTTFDYECVNGILKMDMKSFTSDAMPPNQNSNMEVTFEQTEMELPAALEANQTLKDASAKMILSINSNPFMTMNVTITDRVVQAIETITVPAGTYECAKIHYNINIKMGFINNTTSTNEWFSKKVGLVKTESFDKKGKLSSYSELAEYSK